MWFLENSFHPLILQITYVKNEKGSLRDSPASGAMETLKKVERIHKKRQKKSAWEYKTNPRESQSA